MKAIPSAVPRPWRREVARILIPQAELARRVRLLARQIEDDYRGGELVIVALLTGTILFLADLIDAPVVAGDAEPHEIAAAGRNLVDRLGVGD